MKEFSVELEELDESHDYRTHGLPEVSLNTSSIMGESLSRKRTAGAPSSLGVGVGRFEPESDGNSRVDPSSANSNDFLSMNNRYRRRNNHDQQDNLEEERAYIEPRKIDEGVNGEYSELIPEDDSPYPEVRASVPNSDDPTIPHNTVRMWTIGMLMTTLGCSLNVLFSLHSPVFQISTFVSAIVAWPLGVLWDKVVPNRRVLGLELNPCPFNIKEHAIIVIMANVSFGSGAAYLTDVIITMRKFYGIDFGWGFETVSIIASQAIGFSIAGFVRRVLVYPASMIWPSNLVTTTFLTNIHLKVNHVANGWRISRLHFFLIVVGCYFVWNWVPYFLAPCLSYFSFATWIAPNNIVVNQLFGTYSGLGMLPFTLDWNQIAGYIGSPLIPPFFAVGNILLCIVLVFWIAAPILQYSNVFYGHYLPMESLYVYDRFQQVYQVDRILTKDKQFNFEEYKNYSPVYLASTFAISYGMSFAAISSALVHCLLFDRANIMYYWRNSRVEPDDIHMRLIKRYKEVPDWWFVVSFLAFIALAIVSIRVWPTELPVWSLFVALALAVGFVIPVAIVFALTNIEVGLNVLTEFLVGYMLPGRPVATMMFKTYGYITNSQAVVFLQDMKLGHYLKISPRILFIAQLISCVWGSVVQLVVMNWCLAHIHGVCEEHQPGGFNCPQAKIFFNASLVWGVIGPQRLFSSGQMYSTMLYFFLLGSILPILTWLWLKRRPRSFARYFHWPVFFNGVGLLPPATPFNYITYCMVGYIFGFWIKRNYFNWWAKYNYSLSAGLDLGLALGTFLVFLVTLSNKVQAPNWWGAYTGGAFNTADYKLTPLKTLQDGESFGPSSW